MQKKVSRNKGVDTKFSVLQSFSSKRSNISVSACQSHGLIKGARTGPDCVFNIDNSAPVTDSNVDKETFVSLNDRSGLGQKEEHPHQNEGGGV